MTIEVVTFGCRLNIYESEAIKKAANEACLDNTIIFNSCAVTSEAERKLKQAIRKARRQNPHARIIVTGCAAQINPDEYANMTEVNQVLGNIEKTQVKSYFELTEKVYVNDIMSVKDTASHMVEGFDKASRAFIQVQNGCDHRCTFCIIPYGRGNNRSVPIGEIVNQAKILVDKGYKEIVLTGVDITDYGKDLPGQPKLGQMINRLLNNVPDLLRLRLSSIDVAEVDNELFDLIINNKRLMPNIHLSLQSGDNLILKRMKRRHTRQQVNEFCNKVQSLRPEVVFGADIIAGFPTETEEMFLNTYNLVEEANLTFLHVFPYSIRQGTPAAKMPQVPLAIRNQRAKKLREKAKKQLNKLHQSHINKILKIVLQSNGFGRAEDYTLVKLNDKQVGAVVEAKIIASKENYLIGEKL